MMDSVPVNIKLQFISVSGSCIFSIYQLSIVARRVIVSLHFAHHSHESHDHAPLSSSQLRIINSSMNNLSSVYSGQPCDLLIIFGHLHELLQNQATTISGILFASPHQCIKTEKNGRCYPLLTMVI